MFEYLMDAALIAFIVWYVDMASRRHMREEAAKTTREQEDDWHDRQW